ncbi:TPA: hypothetical protein ACUNF5_007512, partial [Burkholderia orbicola]
VDATQDANLRARLNRRDYANAAALTTDLPVQKRIQTLINGAKAEGLVGEQAAAVMNGKNYASEALAQTDLVALKQALATTGGRVTPAGPVDRNNHPLDEHGKPKTDLTVLPDGTTLVNAKGEPIDPSTGKPKAGANPGDVTRNQAELAELAKANARLDAALKSEKDADRKNLIEEMRASGRVHTDAEATAWLTGKESDKTSTLASEAATLRDVKQLGAAQGAALDGQLDQVKALDTTVGSVKDLDARVTRGVDRDTASVQSLQASVAAQKPIQEQINKLPTGTESEKAIVARMNAKDYASLAAAQADLVAQQAAQTSLDNLKGTDPGAHIVNPSDQAPIVVKGDGKAKDPGRQQDLDRSKAAANQVLADAIKGDSKLKAELDGQKGHLSDVASANAAVNKAKANQVLADAIKGDPKLGTELNGQKGHLSDVASANAAVNKAKANQVLADAIKGDPKLGAELNGQKGHLSDVASANAAVNKAKANATLDGAIAAAGTDA